MKKAIYALTLLLVLVSGLLYANYAIKKESFWRRSPDLCRGVTNLPTTCIAKK